MLVNCLQIDKKKNSKKVTKNIIHSFNSTENS